MKKHVLWVVLPGAIVTLAAAVAVRVVDASILAQVARVWPAVVLIATALFAWRLRTTRVFSANLVIATSYLASQPALFRDHRLIQLLLASLIPVSFALLGFARDGANTLVRLRNHLLVAFAPLAIAAFFAAGDEVGALQSLTRQFIDPAYTDWSGLPQIALLACSVALIGLAVAVAMHPRPVEAGLFWTALTAANALAAPSGSSARGVWLLAGAIVLLVALAETAYSLAFNDELTGLPGRRALNHTINALQAPYAIAIIDVDHFKSFNDEHGHDVGDQVLRMVASRLRAVAGGGIAYRSGGEEFAIVFEGLTKREAAVHVEAVREAVANSRFALRRLPAASEEGRAGARSQTRSGAPSSRHGKRWRVSRYCLNCICRIGDRSGRPGDVSRQAQR